MRNIAVLRTNAVGDFIFALPCLHALRASFRGARITYIGRQWHADFLRERPGPVDEVAVMPPCPGAGMPPDADADPASLERFLDRLRRTGFDLALQAYGGSRYSNPFIRELNASLSIDMREDDAEPLDCWVSYRPFQNRRLQLLEVAALAGAAPAHLDGRLQVAARDRREADAVLPHRSCRKLVLIQPGASDRRRCWPVERFAQVADCLARHGALVAINGTQDEAPLAREVLDRMRYPAIDLSGRLSLSGLCGLLERAALIVSNDTGPLHLALAVGTPAVGIYWLTNLVETRVILASGRPARSARNAGTVHSMSPSCGARKTASLLRSCCSRNVPAVGAAAERFKSVFLPWLSGHAGPFMVRTPVQARQLGCRRA